MTPLPNLHTFGDTGQACARPGRVPFFPEKQAMNPSAGQAKPLPAAHPQKRRGLLIGKGGLYGNVLRIAPPLSVTQHEVEEAADLLLAAIDEVETATCA
jgi:4-aminobutyrate aminotransferase